MQYCTATEFYGVLSRATTQATRVINVILVILIAFFFVMVVIVCILGMLADQAQLSRSRRSNKVHPEPPKAEDDDSSGAPVHQERAKPQPERACKPVQGAGREVHEEAMNKEVEEISMAYSASTSSSSAPIEGNFSNDVRLSLTLNLAYEGRSEQRTVPVGALIHSVPQEGLEFFFLSSEDMAACVGVGLDKSIVFLNSDMSVEIIETDAEKWALQKARWKPILSDASCQLEYNMNVLRAVDDPVQELGMEARLQKYGVGFEDGASHYIVDESFDQKEERKSTWPLLYDIAKFVTTHAISAKQCPKEAEEGNSAGGSQESQNDEIRQKLVEDSNNGGDGLVSGSQDGGYRDGDEKANNNACTTVLQDDDDDDDRANTVMTIIVRPLSKKQFKDAGGVTVESCSGLESASIATKLVINFSIEGRSRERSIAIRAVSRIQLVAESDFLDDENRFGWYHTGIEITLGCQDKGTPRAAFLEPDLCKILDTTTSTYTAVTSSTSSMADTSSGGSQFGARIGAPAVAAIEGQALSSGSRKKGEATSRGQNIEVEWHSVCKGFMYRESSSTDGPAQAKFTLFYPLRNLSIWDNKDFLLGQGLFSTIAPDITGTWTDLNHAEKAPYMLEIKRVMKLHTRATSAQEKDAVAECKQEFVVSFSVNHAMTHLTRRVIPLSGDDNVHELHVPNVLSVINAII